MKSVRVFCFGPGNPARVLFDLLLLDSEINCGTPITVRDSSAISELLLGLHGPSGGDAWTEFLDQFSPVLRQVIVFSVDDPDAQADCFVFVCEKLVEKGFRRLRKFECDGKASFATWLRVVTRNLCLDWARKNYGRSQPFAWTKDLSPLDQQVFHWVYERGWSVQQTFLQLLPVTPGLTEVEVERSAAGLGSRLSSRERWLLSSRCPRIDSYDHTDERGKELFEIPDVGPDPESSAIQTENRLAIASAMSKLSPQEQLLLRLRFEQDLTLQEIARIAGLKDAQSADRNIRALLERVRAGMTGFSGRVSGNAKAASV